MFSPQTLVLVDISSFIFRAFFAIRSLSNSRGEPTNAIYGVATMLARVALEGKAKYLGVVYDSKEPSFRKDIYPEYKANRSAVPDDLIPQFDRIEQLIRFMGVHSYRQSGVEADDLIATLTLDWCKRSPKNEVIIVSSDKDLMQLVNEQVRLWDTLTNKIYSPKEVEEKFAVKPTQIRDYLALLGDASDNIPGVPGVGAKTAADLLREYGDLESILEAAAKGKIVGKRGETLKTHKADALLSAELATLHKELKVKADPKDLEYQFHIDSACIDFLRDLEFHTLIAKWSPDLFSSPKTEAHAAREEQVSDDSPPGNRESEGAGTHPGAGVPGISILREPGVFKTINTEKNFQKLLEGIEKQKTFGFDLETTSLNPRQAEIVGIAICFDPKEGLYIPVGHRNTTTAQLPRAEVIERLKPFLESKKFGKIGQNLKYDWSILYNHGLCPKGILADTMVAAYVLEPEGRHNLEKLAAQYLSYAVTTYETVCGKGKAQICFDEVSIEDATRYSGEDAWIAMHLWNTLEPKLSSQNLTQIFTDIDLPLVDILCRMENQGVCIDEEYLHKLSKEFQKDLTRIEERVQSFAKKPLNLSSPKQMATLLFDELALPPMGKTKTGYSTDASVLESLAPLHEVPRLLLEYREISKLKGTYVDTLPEMKDPKTGKIHASFNQTVAATGRLSSSNPNLQNIPIRSKRGLKIRGAFLASEGNVLISADYSQIELRLLAHMSGDKELVASFQKDEDVHQRTASEIFGIPTHEVSDEQRSIAKAVNFGLMYGKTPFGLAQELKISRKQAQEIIDRYFQRYSGVKRFLDQQVLQAKETGGIQTLLGRKRKLADINSKNQAIRNNAERMAMNTPIQGTAADLIKLAMIHLDEALTRKKLSAKMTIQVHDELVLDCPKEEAKEVKALLVEIMENATEKQMKLSVPLRVNSAQGENWMDL